MNRILGMALSVALGVSTVAAEPARAINLDLAVTQDTDIWSPASSGNFGSLANVTVMDISDGTTPFWLEGIFGIDMTPLTSLLNPGDTLIVDSMTLNVFHVGGHAFDPGRPVGVALANNDLVDESLATWNNSNGQYGSFLSSEALGLATMGGFVGWDVSVVSPATFLTDNFLTFFVLPLTVGTQQQFWSSEQANVTLRPFLSIDYSIVSDQVAIPEPGTLLLLGGGLIGLRILRVRR